MHLLALLALSSPSFAQEITYDLRTFSVYPDGRLRADSSSERLPRGVHGLLPTEDGGLFALSVEDGVYPAESTRDVIAALDEILPAVGYDGRAGELYPAIEGERANAPDLDALTEEAREDLADRYAEIEREVGPLDDTTVRLLEEDGTELYDHFATPTVTWRFDLYVGDARAQGHSVYVVTDGRSIRRVIGALYADTSTRNGVRLDASDAAAAAARYAEGLRVTTTPELVVLADGESLRNAWRMGGETRQGPWELWVDAETGDMVQVEPRFSSFAGQGVVSLQSVPMSTVTRQFIVDDADPCEFELTSDDQLSLDNEGGNGFSDDVTACEQGGMARFDTASISDTTNVTNMLQPNYNPQFQQVNAYFWGRSARRFHLDRGSEDLPEWEIHVNSTNACGSINGACGSLGELTLGIGAQIINAGGSFDAALDPSVILHEFGHGINRLQMDVCDGTLNGSLDEGVADYWAMSKLNQNIVGMVLTGTTSATNKLGGAPRQVDAKDVFPDHLGVTQFDNNEVHGNGQIISAALWNARTELIERGQPGGQVIDTTLMDALKTAGIDEQDTQIPAHIHDAYWSLLISMLVDLENTRAAEDVLVGFAKAGIFLTPHEAIIDIDHDVLSNVGDAPIFTVWTGRDYTVDGLVVTDDPDFNTHFQVELANDEDFTQNVVTSPWMINVGISNGVASGWWQPSDAQWNQLNDEPQLFYRVTTQLGSNLSTTRISTEPGGGVFHIPAGRAIINWGDGTGCATVPGATGGVLVALGGVAAMLRRRSR